MKMNMTFGPGYLVWFMTGCSLILFTSSNPAVSQVRVSKSCQQRHRSVNMVLLDVIQTLGWTSVTIIYNETDAHGMHLNVDELLRYLHDDRVSTMVVPQLVAPCTISRRTLSAVMASRNCLVAGSPKFVHYVLGLISSSPEVKTRDLFETEWLVATPVATPSDHVDTFLTTFAPFRNVAVVAMRQTGKLFLWTLLHNHHDSQLRLVASLSAPPSPPLSRHHVMPNPSYGLAGRTLTVVAKEVTYSLFKTTSNGKEVYEGFLMDLLREFSVRLNFSYTLIPPTDDSWGQRLDNGQWDGPIGMLTRKEADLALGTFSLTPSRSQVADPTAHIMYENTYIVYRAENQSQPNPWTFFLQPFRPNVYAVTGGSLVAVLLMLMMFEACQRVLDRRHRQRAPSGEHVTYQDVWRNLGILVAGVLNRPPEQDARSRAGRVLVMTWLLLGVILASVYSSQLTSSLTVSDQAPPFTSLSQLLSQDTYSWGVSAGTAQESVLKESKNEEFQRFYHEVTQLARTDPTVLAEDYDVHKRKVLQENYAYFSGSSEQLHSWAAETCGINTIPQTFVVFAICFYLQKDSPYTRLFSNEIHRMVNGGLIDHWIGVWTPEKRRCEEQEGQTKRAIALTDTQGAFYLAAVGLGLAALVLLCECLRRRLAKR